MRKSYLIMVILFIIGLTTFVIPLFPESPLQNFTSWGLIATVMVVLTVIAFFFEFESAAVSSKEIALVAMLGTISAVLRVPFAAIPNVQPCTSLIICAGYVFGPVAGFMVGAVTAIISNFFLGQGPWTPYQMLAWGLAGFSAAYIRRLGWGKIGLIIFGIVWGYLYGWILNTWYWMSFIYPLTWKTFMVYQLTSIWFDTLHAIGNALLLAILGMKTIGILQRFRQRFNWSLFDLKTDIVHY